MTVPAGLVERMAPDGEGVIIVSGTDYGAHLDDRDREDPDGRADRDSEGVR